MLMWSAIGFIGVAIFIITNTMFQDEEEFKAQEKIEDADASSKKQADAHGIILKYSRPFFKRYASPMVAQMKAKSKFKKRYRRKLASSGLTDYLTPEDFYSFKLFLILGFPVMFLGIRTFLEETWPLKLIPVLAVVG